MRPYRASLRANRRHQPVPPPLLTTLTAGRVQIRRPRAQIRRRRSGRSCSTAAVAIRDKVAAGAPPLLERVPYHLRGAPARPALALLAQIPLRRAPVARCHFGPVERRRPSRGRPAIAEPARIHRARPRTPHAPPGHARAPPACLHPSSTRHSSRAARILCGQRRREAARVSPRGFHARDRRAAAGRAHAHTDGRARTHRCARARDLSPARAAPRRAGSIVHTAAGSLTCTRAAKHINKHTHLHAHTHTSLSIALAPLSPPNPRRRPRCCDPNAQAARRHEPAGDRDQTHTWRMIAVCT